MAFSRYPSSRLSSTRRRYSYRSPLAKRATGNMRASSTMRDGSNVTLQGIFQLPVEVGGISSSAGQGASATTGNAMGLSLWQLLMNSQFYNNYRGMYDQIKLNGFRIKVLGNSASTLTMASGLSSVSVVTAFDRNGIRGVPYVNAKPEATEGKKNKATPIVWLTENDSSTGNATYTADNQLRAVNRVLTYGSAKSKPWSPGNSFVQYCSGYAQTAQETQEWISTDKLAATYAKYSTTAPNYTMALGYPNGLSNVGTYSLFAPSAEDMTTGIVKIDNAAISYTPTAWDPVFLIGVYNVPPVASGQPAVQTFSFTIEYKIDVSFRGTRAGAGIGILDDKAQGTEILQQGQISVNAPVSDVQYAPAQGTLWNSVKLTANVLTEEASITPSTAVIEEYPSPGKYFSKVTVQPNPSGVQSVIGLNPEGTAVTEATSEVFTNPTTEMFTITPGTTDRNLTIGLSNSPTGVANNYYKAIRLLIKGTSSYSELIQTLFPSPEPYHFDGPFSSATLTVSVRPNTLTQSIRSNGTYHFDGIYTAVDLSVLVSTPDVLNFYQYPNDITHPGTYTLSHLGDSGSSDYVAFRSIRVSFLPTVYSNRTFNINSFYVLPNAYYDNCSINPSSSNIPIYGIQMSPLETEFRVTTYFNNFSQATSSITVPPRSMLHVAIYKDPPFVSGFRISYGFASYYNNLSRAVALTLPIGAFYSIVDTFADDRFDSFICSVVARISKPDDVLQYLPLYASQTSITALKEEHFSFLSSFFSIES